MRTRALVLVLVAALLAVGVPTGLLDAFASPSRTSAQQARAAGTSAAAKRAAAKKRAAARKKALAKKRAAARKKALAKKRAAAKKRALARKRKAAALKKQQQAAATPQPGSPLGPITTPTLTPSATPAPPSSEPDPNAGGPPPGEAPPTSTTTTPTTTTPTPPPPAPAAVGVTESETPTYRTILSRSSVQAGDVILQLVNRGEDDHNLRVLRTDGTGTAYDIPDTAPGQVATRTVRLSPGTYRLYCTLSAPVSHDGAGMHAQLTVTAP